MIPYLVAFSLPVLLYPLRKRSRTAYVFLLASLWAIFAGIRVDIGGWDYDNYYDFYESIRGFSIGKAAYFEPLFCLLGVVAKAAGLNFHGFLCLVGVLGILPAVYVLEKRCAEPALPIFYYGIAWMLYGSFVILRQGLALGLAFMALDALMDKRRWTFAVFTLVAGFFHNSAFVLLPVVLLDGELKPWLRNLLFIFAALAFVIIEGGSQILDYAHAGGIVGRLLKFFVGSGLEPLNPLNILEILGFWFLIFRYGMDGPPVERNLYFLYACVALFSLRHAVAIRFGRYFELGLAFLLPRIAASPRASQMERILLSAGIMAYAFAKVARWLILNGGGNGGFLPYRTIFG